MAASGAQRNRIMMFYTYTGNSNLKVNRKEFPWKIISCLEAHFQAGINQINPGECDLE